MIQRTLFKPALKAALSCAALCGEGRDTASLLRVPASLAALLHLLDGEPS